MNFLSLPPIDDDVLEDSNFESSMLLPASEFQNSLDSRRNSKGANNPTSSNLSRRSFLKGLAAVGVGAALGSVIPSAQAQQFQEAFWSQPRALKIYRPVLRKHVHAVYWQNNHIHMPGYIEICNAMKDQRANVAVAMDIRLLDLLCAMQAWLAFHGYKEPTQINSGYRTSGSNSRLEGAARNSMHIQAKALDVVFPGLPVSYIGKLAKHYQGGGVGFYVSSGFVHIDTGRVRTWSK